MKFVHKFTYIALGGILMLIGMIASSIFLPNLVAQRGSDGNLGNITCTQLRLVNAAGQEIGRLFSAESGGGALRLTDSTAKMTSSGVFLSNPAKAIALSPEMLVLTDNGKMAITLSTISTGPDGVDRRTLKILTDDGHNSSIFLVGDDNGGNLGVLSNGKIYSYPSMDMLLEDLR